MQLCYGAQHQLSTLNQISDCGESGQISNGYKETDVFPAEVQSHVTGLLLKTLYREGAKEPKWRAYQALRQLSWQRAVWALRIVESDRTCYNELASRCFAFATEWRGSVALLLEARYMLLHECSENFFRAGKTCVKAGHWEHTMLGFS